MSSDNGHDGRRQRRAAETVRGALADVLLRDVSDPTLGFVTISDVKLSPDLRSAKVFYTILNLNEANVEKVDNGLKRAVPFFQREIAQKLKMRFTPKLTFRRDESFEQGARIDSIIMENRQDNKRVALQETSEQALARLVANSDKILLCVHANPDGDAIGSLLGMYKILKLLGKNPVAFCPDGVPVTLRFLPGSDEVAGSLNDESFDLTIVMDTGDLRLLPDGFPSVSSLGTLVVIDHHMTHGEFGDVVIRRDVSSVGELLYQLAKELLWPLDKDVAKCLYTSIVSDTGSFRYTSTTAETHRVVADLIETGAEPWESATELFESFSINRQKLFGLVAGTLRLDANEKYAELFCTPQMLEQTQTTGEDLDGMINFGRSVRGVEIAAFFKVKESGDIKISFRSKGRVDVAQLAAKFGGGGHRNAAGATVEGSQIDDVMGKVRQMAKELLGVTVVTSGKN